MATGVGLRQILLTQVKLHAEPENPLLGAKIRNISLIEAEL